MFDKVIRIWLKKQGKIKKSFLFHFLILNSSISSSYSIYLNLITCWFPCKIQKNKKIRVFFLYFNESETSKRCISTCKIYLNLYLKTARHFCRNISKKWSYSFLAPIKFNPACLNFIQIWLKQFLVRLNNLPG